jgi:predicted DNA-binding transcriptional regulator AlpA
LVFPDRSSLKKWVLSHIPSTDQPYYRAKAFLVRRPDWNRGTVWEPETASNLFDESSHLSYIKGSPSQGVAMLSTASPKVQMPASARSPRVDAEIGLVSDFDNSSNSTGLILVTESEVSRLLQVSLARLRKWRVEKRGPRFIKIGSLVRYRLADLHQWLSLQPTGGDGTLASGSTAATFRK